MPLASALLFSFREGHHVRLRDKGGDAGRAVDRREPRLRERRTSDICLSLEGTRRTQEKAVRPRAAPKGSPLRVRQRVVRVCPRPMAARQLAHKDVRQPQRPGVRYGSPASGEREPSTVSCGQKRRPFTIRVLPRARRPCETKPARFPRSAQPASELWKSRFFPI